MREMCKYVTMVNGDGCVTIAGTGKKLVLCVDNWDIPHLVSHRSLY